MGYFEWRDLQRRIRNLRLFALLAFVLLAVAGVRDYRVRAENRELKSFVHDCLFDKPVALPSGAVVTCRITYTEKK